MKSDTETAHLRRVSHWKLYFVIVTIVFGIIFILSLNLGFAPISFSDILKILTKQVPFLGNLVDLSDISQTAEVIIMQIRLPRVICGALVGAALATAGVIYQGIFRNPMADPYVIGAMSGASLGSALVIVLGVGVSLLGVNTSSGLCFCWFSNYCTSCLYNIPIWFQSSSYNAASNGHRGNIFSKCHSHFSASNRQRQASSWINFLAYWKPCTY